MTLSESQRQIIAEVCRGNSDAVLFCEAFVAWVHWIDDVVDKDKLWLPRDIVRVNLEMLRQFSVNRFFQQNKILLMPLMVQSARAFADSVEWAARGAKQDRQASDVLKSNYHEVIWHVAYIIGGWDHMAAMTAKHREFNYDFKE